jgi:hypothetical protein
MRRKYGRQSGPIAPGDCIAIPGDHLLHGHVFGHEFSPLKGDIFCDGRGDGNGTPPTSP